MVNLGIDFGSTYTTVSVFDDGKPINVPPDNNTFHYPSMVAYDGRRYYCGASARNRMGQPAVRIYRGFKMLLNQQMKKEELLKRGYDDQNTPEEITFRFLKYVIETTLENLVQDKVGTLILGAPECWFQAFETADARDSLRKICSRMPELVEKVRIISEPTCAAASCIWNYEKTNPKFDGNILIIDYGGGTLDTAVVSVSHHGDKLKIKPEARSGAGENHDGEIGKAGIAYQENVLKRAVCQVLEISPAEIQYTESFSAALKKLEDILISDQRTIREIFEECLLDPSGLDEEMTTLVYEENRIPVTYRMLKDSYEEVIRPVLKKVLDETVKDLENIDELYIALAGGFCNFYLVQNQVEQYFGMGNIRFRTHNLYYPKNEREKAVSHGTALFAEEIISLSHVAEYGIGMYSTYEDGTVCKNYAIRCGQEYTPNTVYFAPDIHGDPSPMVLLHKDRFILNFSRNPDNYQPMRPINAFSHRLNQFNGEYCFFVGFSFDDDEQISVHLYSYENTPEYRGPSGTPIDVIHLKTLKESFENTIINRRESHEI